MTSRLLSFCLFVACLAPFTASQERDIRIESQPVEKPSGRGFAFLVGVTEYEPPIKTLTYTVADVNAWRKQLERIGSEQDNADRPFQPENIVVMASGAPLAHEPTKKKILNEMNKLLEKTSENDIVICMFSGHGTQVGAEQYFCPKDANIDNLAESCVPLKEVLAALEGAPAKFKWLIVDACRNALTKSAIDGVPSLGKVESVPRGVTAIFSCGVGEMSFENGDLKLGVFTHFLMQGLEGKAADENGTITILDLYKYVQMETSVFVKANHDPQGQVPYWSGEFTNFILRDDIQRRKANEFFRQAITYRQKKEYTNALTAIEEAITIWSDNRKFLEERDLIQQLRETEQEEVNRLKASNYNKQAMAFFEKGEYKKAEEEIEKALKLFPNDEGFLHTKRIIRQAIVAPREAVLADFSEYEAHFKRYGISNKFITASFLTKRAYWKSAAEKGMPEAQLLYGYCFFLDLDDTKRDYKKMLEWYRKAADKKLTAAQHLIGYTYYYGYGVPPDHFEAFKWFQKAADSGYLPAQGSLGNCYEHGYGVAKNQKTAVELYRKTAEQGYVPTQCYLGWCYENGKGVDKNIRTAIGLYRKAADQGFAAAQYALGVCYHYGRGVREDHGEALSWYWKAALQDYAPAQSAVGSWFFRAKDYPEAVRWYRKAVDQDEVSAQFMLGLCYEMELGVPKNLDKAIELYRLAAKQGNEDAQKALQRLEKE